MTATLEAPADTGSDVEPPADPPQPARPVPAALAPWDDPHRGLGWLVTALVGLVAVVTRFWSLGWPPGRNVVPQNGMNFDEIYYATEAQEMLRYGYEDNRGYMFIVHPPLGKWLIALSEGLWDGSSSQWLTNSLGWRIAPALAGIAGVVLLTRIARRMFRSTLLGAIAGLLLALDGLSLVLARTAILDIFLQFFVLAGFGALVVDRDAMRARLAALIRDGADLASGAPSLGPRPWRLAGGVLLGLSCAVKWTGAFFLVLFIVLSLVWDRAALKSAGVRRPSRSWLRRCVITGVGSFVVAPVAAYLFTYLGWFTGENSWNRHWADTHSASAHLSLFGLRVPFTWGWVPSPIRSLGSYTFDAYRFHEGLDSGHAYQSSPWSWLVLGRPVDFYYDGAGTACGAPACSREVLLIGTPLLWWAFAPMLLWLAWRWVTTRDWRAGAVWVAFVAGWVVWFHDLKRTMFLFYMAPLVPFMILGLTLALGVMLGTRRSATALRTPHRAFDPTDDPADVPRGPSARAVRLALVVPHLLAIAAGLAVFSSHSARAAVVALFSAAVVVTLVWELIERHRDCAPGDRRHFWGTFGVSVYLALVVADFAWMWPIFTGGLLTYSQWHAHMWLPSWV